MCKYVYNNKSKNIYQYNNIKMNQESKSRNQMICCIETHKKIKNHLLLLVLLVNIRAKTLIK